MKNFSAQFDALKKEVGKVIVGQEEIVEQVLIAIMTGNNALLEGYPGVAKTLLVRTLADALDLKFSRIQNTPDLMPSDITGTYVIEEVSGKRKFQLQPGPIFANIVLADEINRATPKTQSALLEAMQEHQVTIGTTTYELDKPFFVLATQNPIEQEGTYPLPEAQADRFLLKLKVGYPSPEEEYEIVERYTSESAPKEPKRIFSKNQLLELQHYTKLVPISNAHKARVVKLINATRTDKTHLLYGASPRASIGLILAAKARALLKGRANVTNEDINSMAYPILRHRIILNFESERKGVTTDDAIKNLLEKVK